MSALYADTHRELQDRFKTRRLADRLEQGIVHDAFTDEERAFVESRDMFFLSTVDPEGRPTVSYKGGAPGFVRIEDNALVFPCYDGNGMFYSMGNAAAHPQVGLLFIDFETPHRLRVQGEASLDDGPAKGALPGAQLLVRVRPTQIFVNCSRYIHKYRKLETSKYVPDQDGSAPLALWKRIDFVQDSLPDRDRHEAQAAGPITQEEYVAKVAAGDA
jgi:predicted pyridoxine 5'-phosphate oxidase superfamily flavin-nucleotide-binding protein